MIRVLLDVNILGRGFAAHATRTGIFRASEHFIGAMLLREDVSLGFAAEASWVSEVQFLGYCRERGPGLDGRVVRAWSQPAMSDEEAGGLIDRILADEAAGRDARHDRATLMLMNATARRVPLDGAWDIIHSLRTPLPARSRIDGARRGLTVHDMIPLLFPQWMYDGATEETQRILASLDSARDFVIVNSEATARDVDSVCGFPADRLFVTPLAASADIFYPETSPARLGDVRERHGIPEGRYLLSLCTLEPRKNLPHLVDAFVELLERDHLEDVHLVLVGPAGWKPEALHETLERRAALRSRVRLTGFVNDEDLAAIYSGAAAFVYPSLYEGFGLPVLEAMQCGTPVITSNVASLPEVAGDAAEYVTPTDRAQLVSAMQRLLDDAGWAAELGRRGLERARRFSWDRTAEATVRAYAKVLALL